MTFLSSDHPWEVGPFSFPAGDYYVEAATAADAMLLQQVAVCTVENEKPLVAGEDYNGRTVLVCRSGGFGDLLFMTPVLRALKRRWPQCRLRVATTPYFADALRCHPAVDEMVDYPVAAADVEAAAAVIWLEGAVEFDPAAHHVHYVDLLAAYAGIDLAGDTQMDLHVSPAAAESMAVRYPRRGLRIGVQLRASAACRTWRRTGDFINLASQQMPEAEIMVFDAPDQIHERRALPSNITWLPWAEPALSFGDSVALLATCDVVVAPDSGLCHAAAALGRPVVAVYGSFPWQLRTAYQPTVRAIMGYAECAPCFWHARKGPFPADGPCAVTGKCEALQQVSPEYVLRTVKKLLP